MRILKIEPHAPDSTILSEAFPTEVQALYKTYSEAYVSQNLINLSLMLDLK